MILVTGGAYQGKEAYAKKHYPGASIHNHYHLTVREQLAQGMEPSAEAAKLLNQRNLVVICDEVGCGIVPVSAEERRFREACGRVQCLLAESAEEVVRVTCGLGMVLKKWPRIYLIRHGIVRSNMERRFIGSTDQSLVPGEAERIRSLWPDMTERTEVFVSPLKRCRETASVLFPDAGQVPVEDLREMDFGIYENKNHEELCAYPEYRKCVEEGRELIFPGGETREAFTQRCADAFLGVMEKRTEEAAFVVHGGTIMSLLERFADPPGEFYSWYSGNACGYTGLWDPEARAIRFPERIPGESSGNGGE